MSGFFTIAHERELERMFGPSTWTTTVTAEMVEPPDPPELPDADINPDEAEPLPPEEPVKTDPVPEEPQ